MHAAAGGLVYAIGMWYEPTSVIHLGYEEWERRGDIDAAWRNMWKTWSRVQSLEAKMRWSVSRAWEAAQGDLEQSREWELLRDAKSRMKQCTDARRSKETAGGPPGHFSARMRVEKRKLDVDERLPCGASLQPADESYRIWSGIIRGPTGSAYDGGFFKFTVDMPLTYGLRRANAEAPDVRMLQKVHHPQVGMKGRVNLAMPWDRKLTLVDLIKRLDALLQNPIWGIDGAPPVAPPGWLEEVKRIIEEEVYPQGGGCYCYLP